MTEDERTMKLICKSVAVDVWGELTNPEKGLVKLGLFPHVKMKPYLDQGYDGKYLAIALMNIAESVTKQ